MWKCSLRQPFKVGMNYFMGFIFVRVQLTTTSTLFIPRAANLWKYKLVLSTSKISILPSKLVFFNRPSFHLLKTY